MSNFREPINNFLQFAELTKSLGQTFLALGSSFKNANLDQAREKKNLNPKSKAYADPDETI